MRLLTSSPTKLRFLDRLLYVRLSFTRIPPSCSVGFKNPADFIADIAENFQDFFLAAFGVGWVNESPMVTVHLSRKCRTRLVGVATDGNYGFNFLIRELVQVLGVMLRNVYPRLLHDTDGHWMHIARRF